MGAGVKKGKASGWCDFSGGLGIAEKDRWKRDGKYPGEFYA